MPTSLSVTPRRRGVASWVGRIRSSAARVGGLYQNHTYKRRAFFSAFPRLRVLPNLRGRPADAGRRWPAKIEVMAKTDLTAKKCRSCEAGVPALSTAEAADLLTQVPEWHLSADGRRIRREWRVKDFATGLDFFQRVGDIAEAEDHHPDLHLVGYRNVAIELWTHAIGGLSENDFILAAKIDRLPSRAESLTGAGQGAESCAQGSDCSPSGLTSRCGPGPAAAVDCRPVRDRVARPDAAHRRHAGRACGRGWECRWSSRRRSTRPTAPPASRSAGPGCRRG